MSPIFGLQTPQAITTYSASMSPWSVTHASDRAALAVLDAEVLDLDVGTTVSAPVASAFSRMIVPARSESTTPTEGSRTRR